MYDQYGNTVNYEDTLAFYDLLTFEFEGGSQFSNRECVKYERDVEGGNLIICKIRPL